MEKLSSKVLPFEKWNEVKKNLRFCWLKKEELACCFYSKENELAFLISYDCQKNLLNYYTWDNYGDRSLFAILVNYLPDLPNEKVQDLICPHALIEIIDEYYRTENI